MEKSEKITLHLQDATGQREFVARGVPKDASWGEALKSIVTNMNLPPNTPTEWHGKLEREGRHLHSSETVGDALEDGDHIVLQPKTEAGSRMWK